MLSIPGGDGLQAFKQHQDCVYSVWIWDNGMLVKEQTIPTTDFTELQPFAGAQASSLF